jgi:hypothetical protein
VAEQEAAVAAARRELQAAADAVAEATAAAAAERSGPARGSSAAFAFFIVNQFSMGLLSGRAGRLTNTNGGSRPGQGGRPRGAGRAGRRARAGGQPDRDLQPLQVQGATTVMTTSLVPLYSIRTVY